MDSKNIGTHGLLSVGRQQHIDILLMLFVPRPKNPDVMAHLQCRSDVGDCLGRSDMNPAPIALFVYNRPIHTAKTIAALSENKLASASDLIIFSDGPRSQAHAESVLEVRKYIHNINGFKSVSIVEQTGNMGLAQSIISGVTATVNKHGRVIVLEDDLVTSPYFLQYMNDGLSIYEKQSNVASIHGYVAPILGLPETFFRRGADCWGWATWQDRWAIFEANGEKLLQELKRQRLTAEFDLNHAYPFTQMLADQIAGKNNSWAIRWHASVFLRNKLTLYPGTSLVVNIGHDGTGEHCGVTSDFSTEAKNGAIDVVAVAAEENKQVAKAFERFYKEMRGGLVSRLRRKLRRFWKQASAGQKN
jgi:hypothetical protein